MPRSEKEKMLAGEPYNAADPELAAERLRAHDLCHKLRNSSPADTAHITALTRKLLSMAEPDAVLTPPFFCDYGYNIKAGKRFYANAGCVILDVAPVCIGDDVMFGPCVQVYTATHPLNPELRVSGIESGKCISIGDKVWIGGGAILCPGVCIGEGAVIGAGSVVTRDIPARVLAAGNPCRVIREL